jgi:alkaline phosphatase D
MLRPYPAFSTAPDGQRGHIRFAFASCVGYEGFDSAATWGDMATRTNFDLLLMLGDNHYANTTDPKVFLKYFGVQRRLAGYAEISRRVPQYAIWDNHDYAPEPCDKTARNKERSLEAFKNFWPNPTAGESDNPGVYHQFSRPGIDFFMLDDRYHRSPDNSKDDGTKSLLGEKQLAWLKQGLLAAKAPMKVIACGCEWESHGIKNSWMTFQRERDDLFKFIQDHNITGVLLLSGDRHFTAAYQVIGKFIEVTSGPLGSHNSETKPTSEMFWYSGRGRFYCIYDIDTTAPEPKVVLEIYKASEGLVERRAFTWEEVIGQTKIKTSLNR